MQDANQYAIHGPGDDERKGVKNKDVERELRLINGTAKSGIPH